jgi:murein DD-endopeptidase MepM/ murein hydrolase activator NlpD
MRRTLLALAVAASTTVVAPVADAADLRHAQERERSLRAELDAATKGYIQARERQEEVDERLQEALATSREYGARLADARRVLDEQAALMYRSGGMDLVSTLFSDSPSELANRMELLDLVAQRRAAALVDAQTVVTLHGQAVETAATARNERRALLARQQAELAKLKTSFERARQLSAELRQRQAAEQSAGAATGSAGPGPSRDGVACPMAKPYSYIDTWGFARSGGRRHQGTDIMAPYGTTVLAYTNGRISRAGMSGGLGGVVIYLQGEDGNEYYYAHLQSVSVRAGQRVRAGQPVGRNGASGNAPASAPHVHFEVHPGGGSPVNPYPWVQRACG